MPDISAALPTTELEDALLRVIDTEGKLTAALEDLGPVSGRDVVVLDAGRGHRAGQLAEIGARVTAATFADPHDERDALDRLALLPAGEADVVVIMWSQLAVPGSEFLIGAERLLRPGGRLLIVGDYGRDDVWNLWPSEHERMVEWSQRRGPFLSAGFRIRVIHSWWTFGSPEEARWLLGQGFGECGLEMADRMRRLRLEYQIAIYHRTAQLSEADSESDSRQAAPEDAVAVG